MKLKGSVSIEYVAIVIAIAMFVIPATRNLYEGVKSGFKLESKQYVDLNNVTLVNSNGLDTRVQFVEAGNSD